MASAGKTGRQGYVYGSTARAGAVRQYEYGEARRERIHSLAERRAVRENQEKALRIDMPYLLVLTAAVVCVLCICVNYLHVQSSMTAHIHNIEQLEQQLEELKAENDALQTRINTNIDLNHVYEVATGELGMVYANPNQVILYGKTESEYVRQYEDIPEY